MNTNDAAKVTLLIAEDHEDIRFLLKFHLEALGYKVVEAEDGNLAVERAISKHPDLILMDLNMPGLDGYEATRQIHRQPQLEGVPVVAVSAYCDALNRHKALAAGCVECVCKPLNLSMIDGVLRKHLPAHCSN